MDNELPLRSLTIHLSKENQSPESLIENSEGITTKTVVVGRRTNCPLFIKPSVAKPPSWARFFEPYVTAGDFGLVSTASAVLLVPVYKRWAALTFGQGRYLLAMNQFEDQFGLRVVLNCIDKDRIKVIDKQTFDAIASHTLEQASQEANAREFGFDIERDILRAVTGTPRHPDFGNRMSGKEALSAVVRTDLKQLENLLEVYHKQFLKDSYRTDFEWVDQIRPVTDSALDAELTDALVKLIRNRTVSDRCWLAVPDIIEWSRVNGFYYNRKPSSLKYYDLDLQTFLRETFSDLKDLSEDRLKKQSIYCMDTDDQLIERWSAFNCLYCEVDYKGHSYVLNAGKWYMLDKDFVKRVNDSFEKMPRYSGAFIEYDDETETIYNKRLVTESGGKYHLLDRDLTYRGGKMEFCDVFSKSKELIHIKRQGGSSTLSHLFYQGTTSAEFFLIDPEYRKLVFDKLPKEFQIFKSDITPMSEEFHVVFGIISDNTELRLPFFSRVGIRHAVSRLKGFRYKVSLARIGVAETRSKLKKVKTRRSK